MSAFETRIKKGATMQECVEGVSSFSTGHTRLYVEGAGYYDGPLVTYVRCHGEHGSGPISAEEVRAILNGAEPVVQWDSDPDLANNYVHWHDVGVASHRSAEHCAVLLAAQLTLCLEGLWPRVPATSI
jgi:hypothetical protein